MAFLSLLAAIVAGCLEWSGWWALPIGALMYWGSLRALPGESSRIHALGIPIYAIGTFLIMKASGWIVDVVA